MSSAPVTVDASNWINVEVGRMVRFPETDKIACIVDIIDHKRVLVENPSEDASQRVLRHAAPLSKVYIDKLMVNIPRGARHGTLKKAMDKAGVMEKFTQSVRAQKRAKVQTRRQLSDFERFKVMVLKKQARLEVRKSYAAARKASKA